MDIRLYVSKAGGIYLACIDGVFDSPIEHVQLNHKTHFMALKFADMDQPIELNCQVDQELSEIMKDKKDCILGLHLNGKVHSEFRFPLKQIHT